MFGTEAIPNIMPFAHGANAIALQDGRILVTWYCGSYEGSEDQRIAGTVRDPDGKWQPTRIVVDRFTFAGDEWVPEIGVPVQHPGGEVRLYFWAIPLSNGFHLISNPCYMRMVGGAGPGAYTAGVTIRYESPVWTREIAASQWFCSTLGPDFVAAQPRTFGEERGLTLMGAALHLRSGRWLLPYDTWGQYRVGKRVRFLVSDENLAGWESRGDLSALPGCSEGSVVQLASGDLLCYMRRRGFDGNVWRAVSHDEGRTWSGPVPTNLRNPDAPVDIKVSQTSGRLLITFDDSYQVRCPLCVGISSDEGQTFHVRDVESQVGFYPYPKLLQSQDGLWHLFYSYDYRHIQHTWFDEAWVEGGRRVIGGPLLSEHEHSFHRT